MLFIDRLKNLIYGFAGPSGLTHVGERHDCSVSRGAESSAENFSRFPERVLFVCSGNICRSPYAEYRFRSSTAESHPETMVKSAGILRIVGRSASQDMISVASERGLDLSRHRSSSITRGLVEASDIVFVMGGKHREEVLRISPTSASKIVMLGAYLDVPGLEIEDPIGRSRQVYKGVADKIDEALSNWLARFHTGV